eukprot:2377565-Pleurochrysis_carterae.AAC.1
MHPALASQQTPSHRLDSPLPWSFLGPLAKHTHQLSARRFDAQTRAVALSATPRVCPGSANYEKTGCARGEAHGRHHQAVASSRSAHIMCARPFNSSNRMRASDNQACSKMTVPAADVNHCMRTGDLAALSAAASLPHLR